MYEKVKGDTCIIFARGGERPSDSTSDMPHGALACFICLVPSSPQPSCSPPVPIFGYSQRSQGQFSGTILVWCEHGSATAFPTFALDWS